MTFKNFRKANFQPFLLSFDLSPKKAILTPRVPTSQESIEDLLSFPKNKYKN